MIVNHLIALTMAYGIDRIVGDPKSLPHPVRMIGKSIAFFERHYNDVKARKLKGVLVVLVVVMMTIGLTFFLTYFAYGLHRYVGIAVEAVFIATTIATKGLADAARDVYVPLIAKDKQKARKNLSFIVGRDTERLSEADIVRATVETVAENTSDGITAPLFWALIGGAPLALAYRAINTCDSMLGYKNERFSEFGWAAARLDDLVNLFPSRLTAFVTIIVNKPVPPHSRRDCFRIVLRDANKHASPNSGWLESATAALLGIQLGGRSTYKGVVSERPFIGTFLYPLAARHIVYAIALMHRTVIGMMILLWIGGGIFAFARAWFESTTSF